MIPLPQLRSTGGLTPGIDLLTPAGSASVCARRAWWQTKDVASLSFLTPTPNRSEPSQSPGSHTRISALDL